MMVVALLPLASCSENETMDYAGQPALYFDNAGISYSFFY